MDVNRRYTHKGGLKRLLEEMAGEISGNPFDWVLILGNGISSQKQEHVLGEMSKEALKTGKYLQKDKIIKAVQAQDYQAMKDCLFGAIWDGGSFLDPRHEEQSSLRGEYARWLAKKEEINTECVGICLELALRIFPGIIMTTCQDETVEAFLENEGAMVTDGLICTPYSLTASDRWRKWRDAVCRDYEESAADIAAGVLKSNPRVLIKLCGSCNKPNRMLLSHEDFDIYYPEDKKGGGEPELTGFLTQIFTNKNLFFLGVEPQVDFPPGILRCLAETKNQKKRYALAAVPSRDGQKDATCWDGYGVTVVSDRDISLEALFKEKQMNRQEAKKGGCIAKGELFWKLYIRRSYAQVSRRERYILENDILGYTKNGISLKWSSSRIYILAMLANNLEDFYDLKKAFDRAGDQVMDSQSPLMSEDYCGELLWSMMNERLDGRCRKLYRMLAFYGSDFPVEFLQLIGKDKGREEDRRMDVELDDPVSLEQWKRAGIQLANSGICIQQGDSRDIYRRIELADSIMETAGSKLDREDIENIKKETVHILSSSYFHLSSVVNREIKNRPKYDPKKIKSVFAQMFKNLSAILANNSKGYNELRSLLAMEMPVLMKKINGMEDRGLEWKPELIYRLFLACPVQIKENWDEIDSMMRKMQLVLDSRAVREQPGPDGRWRSKAAMLHQTQSIIKSQSYNREAQLSGLEESKAAAVCLRTYGRAKNMPEDIFRQLIQTHIQSANICGRLGTIVEIDRSRKMQGSCLQQQEYLDSMKKYLQDADKMIQRRKDAMNISCTELEARISWLWGKYYFKKNQFLSENRRFGKQAVLREENASYEEGEKAYLTALALYNGYSEQYEVQRADVMRSLGDLYCRRAKDMARRPEYFDDREENPECLMKKCRGLLTDAYILYRKNHVLRGMADVLQSRGGAEDYSEKPRHGRRSPLTFYNMSKAIYNYVGDQWSRYVVIQFYINALEGRMNNCDEADRERLKLQKAILKQEQLMCE